MFGVTRADGSVPLNRRGGRDGAARRRRRAGGPRPCQRGTGRAFPHSGERKSLTGLHDGPRARRCRRNPGRALLDGRKRPGRDFRRQDAKRVPGDALLLGSGR